MTDKPKSKPNPKLDKFLKEVNDLGDKYKFQIVPTLRYSADAIVPSMKIVDMIPEDDKANGKPIISDKKDK